MTVLPPPSPLPLSSSYSSSSPRSPRSSHEQTEKLTSTLHKVAAFGLAFIVGLTLGLCATGLGLAVYGLLSIPLLSKGAQVGIQKIVQIAIESFAHVLGIGCSVFYGVITAVNIGLKVYNKYKY